ncbi:MAG TPA: sugar phosphate isomerase/epimerase [Nitrososphaeraceae archaeon]|nr:sugar phosphate isomerase/epimerase [Nitrososphaeraceae archaeon]
MKLAFSTNAFKKYSLDFAIKEISKIGYEGVEILCDSPHAYPPEFEDNKINETRKLISDLGLEISNLNAFTLYSIGDVYHPSWIESSNELRKSRINHTINCINLAEKLGAKNLSTEPGGPFNYQKPNGDRDKLLKIFVKGLLYVSKFAEKKGIKILVEPEPSLLIENSIQFLELMRLVDSDYIRLNFDIGHFYCVGEDPAAIINKLVDYTEHFHFADIASNRVHYHLKPGDGSIDFVKVVEAIEKTGYKDFVTVELYPYQDNPVEVAKTAYQYLTTIIR